MGIGNVRGKAIDAGGEGGSFDRQSLAWLAQKGTLYAHPGIIGFFATGGTKSTYNGKTIHQFPASGAFTVQSGTSEVQYVLIAGGGGGGGGGASPGQAGGGGGAGGIVTNIPAMMPTTNPALTLTPGTLTVTVGDGGSAGSPTQGYGFNGEDTVITGPAMSGATVTATGGGGGGVSSPNTGGGSEPGRAGGCGGGGAESTGSPGPGSQGDNGGVGSGSAGSTENSGGGGGGCGGNGSNAPGNAAGGHGGYGVRLPAMWRDPATAPSLGVAGPGGTDHWVGGGGGGGTTTPGPSGGSGGKGGGPGGPYSGGGDGGTEPGPSGSTNGADGTGGGGGSAENQGTPGGSGLVLIGYDTP